MGNEISPNAIPPVSPIYPLGDRKYNLPNYFKRSQTKQPEPDPLRLANNSLYSEGHIDLLA